MKVCIVGAGAIGVYLAVRLERAGHDVTVIARGARAAAIRENGLALTAVSGEIQTSRPLVLEPDQAGSAERQDAVFVTVKGYSVTDTATALRSFVNGGAQIVFVQNGLPWWYLRDVSERNPLDPDGAIAQAVPMDHVVGCVTYANVRNSGYGTAQHVGDDTFVVGRPDGRSDPVLGALVQMMSGAGLNVRSSDFVQRDIWIKLWATVAINPISALTGATMDLIVTGQEMKPTVIQMMNEVKSVAQAFDVDFGISVEKRLDQAAQAGAFRTSMLQDLEAGRRMEIDAIIGSVCALARHAKLDVPVTEAVFALIRQRASVLGLEGRPQ